MCAYVCALELEKKRAHNYALLSRLVKINHTRIAHIYFHGAFRGGAFLHVWKNSCVCQSSVTQQNGVRARLQDIPEITNMIEGGEGELGIFYLNAPQGAFK